MNGTDGDIPVYTFFEAADNTVGASLLAMVVNDNAGCL